MKMPNGLKTIMLVLDEEERTNKDLISAAQSDQTTGATPAPHIAVFKYPSPAPSQPLIGSLKSCFPDTSVKLLSTLQNNKNDSI